MSTQNESKPSEKSSWKGYSATKVVILILLLLILYYVVPKKGENFDGFRGQSYSAGATQRVVQQEFSGTNQQPYESGYNTQILNQLPLPESSRNVTERFSPSSAKQTRGPLRQEEILAAQLYSEHFTSPDDIVKQELVAAKEFTA